MAAAVTSIADLLEIRDPTEFAIALSDFVFARCEAVGFAGLTPAEQVVYCVDWLEREVNNGGFSQFFFNSAGDFCRETVAALRAVGADHTAQLVERAMALFPNGQPAPDRSRRQEQLDALGEAPTATLGELDDQFYEYHDDLTSLVRSYVRAHQQDFRETP